MDEVRSSLYNIKTAHEELTNAIDNHIKLLNRLFLKSSQHGYQNPLGYDGYDPPHQGYYKNHPYNSGKISHLKNNCTVKNE